MKSNELYALAERCEKESASPQLNAAIFCAVHSTKDKKWLPSELRLGRAFLHYEGHEECPLTSRYSIEYRYTHDIDDALTLEPGDAQEICVRKYQNGTIYVRVSTKDGTPIYLESFDKPMTEALARCAVYLKVMAYELS